MSEKENEEHEFQKFVSESLRGPKGGSFESLLCQHLVAAVNSKPLGKIRLTCEAALMVEDLQSKGIDKEELAMIHQVALGFINTSHYNFQGLFYCYMSFPFQLTQENYEKYILPWLQSGTHLRYWATFWRGPGDREYAERHEHIQEQLSKLPEAQWFFHITKNNNLAEIEYSNLLSQFTSWALPKTQIIFSKLAKLVNPGLFQEILSLYQGESRREDTPRRPED